MRNDTRHYSKADAIALHAEAHKSDPFAAKRVALHLSLNYDNAKDVGSEAHRTISARKANTRLTYNAFAGLAPLLKRKGGYVKHKLSMSMFASRADFEAAQRAA